MRIAGDLAYEQIFPALQAMISSHRSPARSRRVICERLERDACLDCIEERRIQSCRAGSDFCPGVDCRNILGVEGTMSDGSPVASQRPVWLDDKTKSVMDRAIAREQSL